jgi:glycosyltransferase involved in cell wall biosynthesis
MNSLSVVIPTKDRAEALARTLGALEDQRAEGAALEAVVIDNGSSDDTLARVERQAASSRLSIRLLKRPEGGPAAARNAGAAAASGEVLLFLGDDTEPADEHLLRAHLDLHTARPEPTYGVLGRITWTTRKPVTPFMRWLENGGPQFHYCDIEAGPVDAASYFYSSHASLKRSLFAQVGGFDERFPTAAVEDTELGVRLAEAGLELAYHPELLVLHDHPTTPQQSLRRSVAVGRSAALYNRLRPDRPHAGVQAPRGLAWSLVRLAEPLFALLARLPLPRGLREAFWLAMTRSGYARGYREGAAEAR